MSSPKNPIYHRPKTAAEQILVGTPLRREVGIGKGSSERRVMMTEGEVEAMLDESSAGESSSSSSSSGCESEARGGGGGGGGVERTRL